MSSDEDKYRLCMEEIKQRLALVQAIGAKEITTGQMTFDIEVAFLNLRKILELIAFSSLIANKAKYSAAYTKFATHWKAKDMLLAIERLNPDFYPMPVDKPRTLPDGTKRVEPIIDGYLAKDEFAQLYDRSSEILHCRNPFTSKKAVVSLGYSTKEWVSRIQRLLALHVVCLVDGRRWIVQVEVGKTVTVWTAEVVGHFRAP